MPDFSSRSLQKELLDEPSIPQADLFQNLTELAFINTYLGGHQVIINAFKPLLQQFPTAQIIEIGSGGGDNLAALQRNFKKKFPDVRYLGVDLKTDCQAFASSRYPTVDFQCNDYRLVEFDRNRPTLFFSSLFCHHFSDDSLVEMLKWLNKHATAGFVIADLHRHSLAYWSIKWLTKWFSSSYLVKNDAPLSVLRGFSKKEWIDLLEKAEIQSYQISWKWAFRWVITVRK
ncbi:MAG: methyltransferase domain-containing protein [Spirosomataceae bacterium]